jgi:hypothetical protein
MPNHYTSRCTVTGQKDSIDRFSKLVFKPDEKEGMRFDLSSIVPIPTCFPDEEGVSPLPAEVLELLIDGPGASTVWRHFQRLRPQIGEWRGLVGFENGEMAKIIDEAFPGSVDKARIVAKCYGETGYFNVIDWAYGEWGTKWNAYRTNIEDQQDGRICFKFETANGFPRPVFEKIAAMFPELKFDLMYFDEGWNNAGRGFFNGSVEEKPFADEVATKELYELVYGEPYVEAAEN